jgi:hypothetical protein
VGSIVAATLLVFFLTVRVGGPALGIYWSCDFAEPSATCRQGLDTFHTARRDRQTSVYYWVEQADEPSGSSPGVILHSTRYLLYPALLFALGPLVIAWHARRHRFRTAGLALILNWVGASLVAFTSLGFAAFEGVVIPSIQLHILAGVVWCLAGGLGMWLGGRLKRNVDVEADMGL